MILVAIWETIGLQRDPKIINFGIGQLGSEMSTFMKLQGSWVFTRLLLNSLFFPYFIWKVTFEMHPLLAPVGNRLTSFWLHLGRFWSILMQFGP